MPDLPWISPGPPPTLIRQVDSLSDLPTPIGGVITLVAGVTYVIIGFVDLLGNRLVADGIVGLKGLTSETSGLLSTGLVGTALITSEYTLPMQDLAITADIALDLGPAVYPGDPTAAAYDYRAVNFIECASVGTVRNCGNFIVTDSVIRGGGGITFDEQVATISFSGCLLSADAGETAVTVAATAIISRRFRIIYSAVVAGPPTATGLDVSVSASIPDESYILDEVSFGGSGTAITGVAADSITALFILNNGIMNSASIAHYYMVGNATVTTITTPSVAVKAEGVTLDGPNVSKFTQTDNRATFTGALIEFYEFAITAALTCGNNRQVSVFLAKNGATVASSEMRSTTNGSGRVEAIATLGVVELVPGDYVEVWVANNTNTDNITVTDLQLVGKRIV